MVDRMDAEGPAPGASRCQHETAQNKAHERGVGNRSDGKWKKCSCVDQEVMQRKLQPRATSAAPHQPIVRCFRFGRFERAVCDIGGRGACARVGNVGGRSRGGGDEEASHASPSVRHESVIGKSSAANGEARGKGDTQPREAKWKW